ncbi:hypothetical protein [Couchioplanes caeruleus]|uniref:Uncharacterized protein n=2 Tax=Couchioplanes caeruleus TaxID=56438 RepID=A0A1K0FX11_9ACTN|nr:hypothetical protein [Couchioplanes caeruleus]OJF09618.1 hypothetical protein BG844_36640 [Couchioplanes caeruleus subsp. caeruleus]ROP31126.1 hypothetical protein EDD30_4017 [Couchioplanes caeruleus]
MTGAEFSEVDFDLLADYVGGALDGTPDEAVVSALIVGHPAWRRAHAELSGAAEAMTAALGAWGAEPEPMPADVATRLDVALAAANSSIEAGAAANSINAGTATNGVDASAADSSVEASATAGDGLIAVGADAGSGGAEVGGVTSGADRVEPGGDGVAPVRRLVAVQDGDERATATRKRARRMRWAAPIGIAAGLVAFLGFGIPQFGGGETQEASTSAGSAADQAAPQSEAFGLPAGPARMLASGIDYTAATLPQAAPLTGPEDAAATVVPQPPGTQGVTPPSGAAQSGASQPVGPAVDASQKVRGMTEEPRSGVMISGDDPLQRLRVQEALLACIDAIGVANRAGAITAQGIDYARFEGAPALVVRFTAGNGTWVWAAGADCGTPGSGADKLGAVKVG